MKILLIALFAVLTVFPVLGQKKSKVDPKDLQIDSLTKASTAQSVQVDSLSRELEKYYGVYATLKEKVFKYDFDPAKTSSLIDSLRTTRDSTFSHLSSDAASSKDSLLILKTENMKLQATIDSLGLGDDPASALANQEADRQKAIKELKELKELLDAKIITQAEFDSKKNKLLEKL